MNGRELMTAIYARERFDRLPVNGVGPWTEALERWRREGLGPNEDWNVALGLAGCDDFLGLPLNVAMLPQFDVKILGRDQELVTLVDEFGVTKRMLVRDFDYSAGKMSAAGTTSSMSEWLDFPVKDLPTWKRIYEERFRPDLAERLPADWSATKSELREKARTRWVIYFSFPFGGPFSAARQLMGLEGAIFAMADNPALIRTMMSDLCDFYIAAYAGVVADVPLDGITFFEDMCATKAPLVSPAMFREFFAPGYRRITAALRDLGVRHLHIDTDGNAWNVIPEFSACGLTGTSPCEAQADMDVGRLREAFPEFVLAGGIDKRALVRGPAAIDAELKRRFTTAWTKSRYTPSLDHGAPPDISWANAQYYARRVVEFSEDPKAAG